MITRFGRRLSLNAAASLLAVWLGVSAPAGAQQAGVAEGLISGQVPSTPDHWTPRRLLNAVPMTGRAAAGFQAAPLSSAPAQSAALAGGSGSIPTAAATPRPEQLVHAPLDLRAIASSSPTPALSTGFGPFSESRVFPSGPEKGTAVVSFPYRTVGELFFHDPRTGQDFVCSAAVNSPRAILTAGSCIAHGSASSSQRYYYSNFLFIPAYDNGSAPFGKWGSTGYAITTASWFDSGRFPNPQDFGFIEAADRNGKTLGSVVGWLGWETLRLTNNHFTTLGYPCNLDKCLLMQRNDAQTSAFGGNNTWIVGSDMGSGIGGGPWIQDFGLRPKGAPVPAGPCGGNCIVGVTSYLPASRTFGFLGASQFDQVFVNLRRTFCAHKSGNC